MNRVTTRLAFLAALLITAQAQAIVLEDFESGTSGIFVPLGDFGVLPPIAPEVPISGIFSGYLTTAGTIVPSFPPYSLPPLFAGPALFAPLDFLGPISPLAPGTIDGLSPTGALHVQGTVVQAIIVATAGDTLSFDYNFLTMEGTGPDPGFPRPPLADFAFFTLQSLTAGPFSPTIASGALADAFGITAPLGPSPSPFFIAGLETGVLTASHTFAITDLYVLTIGVVDAGDPFYDSGLVIDNLTLVPIPEPASMTLLGLGLAGLALRRRFLG